MGKFYTGVGSRKTPIEIMAAMSAIAVKLGSLCWTLRSGGAAGADSAFQSGAELSHIYLAGHATAEAMEISARFHPAWHRCSDYAKNLHARNAFQILGRNLKTPSRFLICWTPDGCITHATRTIETGGTGTAISIADHYGVEVFNLARPEHLERLASF